MSFAFAPLKCLATAFLFSLDNFQPFSSFTIEFPNVTVTGRFFFLGCFIRFFYRKLCYGCCYCQKINLLFKKVDIILLSLFSVRSGILLRVTFFISALTSESSWMKKFCRFSNLSDISAVDKSLRKGAE